MGNKNERYEIDPQLRNSLRANFSHDVSIEFDCNGYQVKFQALTLGEVFKLAELVKGFRERV